MGIPADEVLAPLWSQGYVAATSNTAATIDLRTLNPGNKAAGRVGEGPVPGRYIRVYAITTDVAIVCADTSTHAGNIVFPASGNAGTNAATFGAPIFASTYQDFIVPVDQPFLGFITASAAGVIVIYVNSRPI